MTAQDISALHKQALHQTMLSARQKAFMAHLQMDESLKECQANPDDAAALAELMQRKATASRLMDEYQAARECI